MTDPQPYPGIDHTDRLAVGRLRSAAKRGDRRADATLQHIDQQKHTDAWQAAEQRRADQQAERANRKRPGSVAAVMEERRKARDEKEARRQANLEPS